MVAPVYAPFGDYSGIAAGSGVTKATINAALDNLLALIPAEVTDPTAVQTPMDSPDFGDINLGAAERLRDEIEAIQAAVTAAA